MHIMKKNSEAQLIDNTTAEKITLRSIIEKFVYHDLAREIDRTGAMVEKIGDEATYCGYPALNDIANMTRGNLISSTITLAVYKCKNGDPGADAMFSRVNNLIHMLLGTKTATWGKLAVLNGLSLLMDEGLLDKITAESIEICKEATDYGDFLDKETLTLINKATNYYHVAMECAARREKLGFESEGMSQKIMMRLLGIMDKESSAGWSDEQPSFGRFDLYTLEVPSHLMEQYLSMGQPVPQNVMDSFAEVVSIFFWLRNPWGDGFPYGRSRAVNGDLAQARTLLKAMQMNMLSEQAFRDAHAYIARVAEKVRDFWYDPELGCVNLWLKGRNTDLYRNITRILEVNMGVQNSMRNILQSAEALGIADMPVPESDYGYTDTWQCKETIFDEAPDKKRAAYFLRRGDRIFALPLIGTGKYACHAAYLPFPVCARFIESPQDTSVPFLTPRYKTADGKILIPAGFFREIRTEISFDKVVIYAQGQMSIVDPSLNINEPKPYGRFSAVYTFEGDYIRVSFDTDVPVVHTEMFYAGPAKVKGYGFEQLREVDATSSEYDTIHGSPSKGIEWTGSCAAVGYEILLQEV